MPRESPASPTELALSTGNDALARISAADAEECRRWIAVHSRSFYVASRLLPARVREASWALYAFCRRADDAVDEDAAVGGLASASDVLLRRVEGLRRRLDRVYGRVHGRVSGQAPGTHGAVDEAAQSDPIDRAYATVALRYGIPRGVPEALLAGMEMDARGTRYATWDELYVYCFRVASTVGLMMTRVMGASREDALLRAADLGLAMQLTNIARDVGEDARRGRVYLPDELLAACGTDDAAVLAATTATGPIAEATRRLLLRAGDHYQSADRGVPLLPRSCRPSITSARHIYSAIGDEVARAHFDSITRRAHTSLGRKLLLVLRSLPSVLSSPRPPAEGPADALLGKLIAECGL